MIRIRVKGVSFTDGHADWRGGPIDLAVDGHALFAPKGNDIVCAGVSVLVQSLARFLVSREVVLEVSRNEDHFGIGFSPDSQGSQFDGSVLGSVEMTLHGLTMMAESYPDHVDIEIE
ncbi:MAG TPA: ribosomal-processing cysteine protease Prp [Spirochaetota bacterium]